MKTRNPYYIILFISIAFNILFIKCNLLACSTFKLQKGNGLIYGHNLNQGDIGVPGMIFINKRGIFKKGRTWSELITKEQLNPSSLNWISRYGSVTFNVFGRDLPDGGINEAGLCIWEMNADFDDYPKNDSLPKLDQMNWMQYILDNYSTTEEAIRCASEIEIDGWGWHFFIGDAQGNTAAIDFINGEIVVSTGKNMPVPGLFNTPYPRELELIKYYEGFGGLYEADLSKPTVPRFVKTAQLIRDYDPSHCIVDYGLKMLDQIKVYDEPEWSVLFNVREQNVYFKTRINPGIKSFSMKAIDFSNETPVLILNMDIKKAGDVLELFHHYSGSELKEFSESYVFPILPEEFFTYGGLTTNEYLVRISTLTIAATLPEKQDFSGTWKNAADTAKGDWQITLKIETKKDAVSGQIAISNSENFYKIEHIQLVDNNLVFSFHTKRNTLIDVHGIIKENKMYAHFAGMRDEYGKYSLFKK